MPGDRTHRGSALDGFAGLHGPTVGPACANVVAFYAPSTHATTVGAMGDL
jgi:hypothetical protein